MDVFTEKKYLKESSKGDSKAFEFLFLYYQPKLVYFITGFIKDSELARDMVQDIFSGIWVGREKLVGIYSFQSYLYQIAKNAIYNYYDHLLVNEKYETSVLAHPEETVNVEDEIFANELQCLIEIAISKMPPQRKLIYELSRIQGMDNAEIASKLNLSKRTVENHLTLALADIRKAIKLFLLIFFC